jgi:murein DD-endopeptidase MepM/ murein hydrolase activator NlpD
VIFAGQVAGVVWVTVDHGGGLRTTYGPLRRVLVRRGTTVAPGTPIASAAGPLHFGVRVDGRYVDPANLLARPVHLVPRLFSPSARIARPPVLPCGATSPFRFAARSR